MVENRRIAQLNAKAARQHRGGTGIDFRLWKAKAASLPVSGILATALLFAPALSKAIDPPHESSDCTQCHIAHSAAGGSITAMRGNANLCLSCHTAGGTASAKAYNISDQARAWPGLASTNAAPSGTSHRWDAGVAGYVLYIGGASIVSSGSVSSAGVFTGAYAKTYSITIRSNGNAGVATFNWSATNPGGGGGTNVLTASSVPLNEGISAVFLDATNGISFRSNDTWRISVRNDIRFPTNTALAARMTNGFMYCSTCHDEHSQLNTPFDASAPAYGGPGTGAGRHMLQMNNNAGQMCADCHAPRDVTNAVYGSHPVGLTLSSASGYRIATNLPLEKTTGMIRCETCHTVHNAPSADGALLRIAGRNDLCTSCHTLADTASPGSHLNATNTRVLWPGGAVATALPARTNAAERGSCVNCHVTHGWPDASNTTVKYAMLLPEREENTCFACHDGNGPSQYNLQSVFNKASKHPVALTGLHSAHEGNDPAAFGAANRHAECVDCHNPHVVKHGYGSETNFSSLLLGVSRIAVSNGAAGTSPSYTFIPATNTDVAGAAEYQVCFKCHSGWTTLPAGAPDLGIVFNPANESMHPVLGPGKNPSQYIINSLTNGTGLPHLTVTSVVTCADCHNNDQIPLTVSLVSLYTGTVVRGPHGAVSNASMSGAILRGNYKLTQSGTYSANNFSLCYICHSPLPFGTSSTTSSNALLSRFNWHGKHMTDIGGACVDCHSDSHGTKQASVTGNRNYAQLVSFGPAVTGNRTWTTNATGGSCNLTCHGKNHDPYRYPNP